MKNINSPTDKFQPMEKHTIQQLTIGEYTLVSSINMLGIKLISMN